jgi:hypothetical protein
MKRFLFGFSMAWLLPSVAFATALTPQQKAANATASFVDTFNTVILYPTIALLSAVAFFIFLWGAVEYFLNANNDQARQQGVKHMTWGFIGLVVMISAFTILALVAATFGLDDELRCANDPQASGCGTVFTIP